MIFGNWLPQRLDSLASPKFARVLVGDGSVSLPGSAFTTSPTTGWYLANPGTGQIGITNLGRNSLYIYSNGTTETYIQGNGNAYISFLTSGTLALYSAGTNQNINLTPSGSGRIVVSNPSTNNSYLELGVSGTNQGYFNIMGGTGAASLHSWQLGMDSFSGVNGFFFYDMTRGAYCGKIASATGNWLFGSGTSDSGNGLIQLATHTTSAGGIGFGPDLSVFRFSATTLRLSAAANSYFSVDGPAANEVGFGYTKSGSTIWVSYVPSAGSTDLRWNNGSDRWLMNSAGQFLGITPTGGLGYGSGAGGAVTQGVGSGKGTAFTLSKVCGIITMDGASLAANTTVSCTWTNTALAATDAIIFQHDSVGTLGAYSIGATVAAGSATLFVRNLTAGALAEAIKIKFAVIKAVTA